MIAEDGKHNLGFNFGHCILLYLTPAVLQSVFIHYRGFSRYTDFENSLLFYPFQLLLLLLMISVVLRHLRVPWKKLFGKHVGPWVRPLAFLATSKVGLFSAALGIQGYVSSEYGIYSASVERLSLGGPYANDPCNFMVTRDAFDWVVLYSATILAPIGEEIFFRGILFRWLVCRLGVVTAVVVDSLIFGFAHGLDRAFTRTILGGIQCFAFLVTGSLWMPIVLHIFNNLVYSEVIIRCLKWSPLVLDTAGFPVGHLALAVVSALFASFAQKRGR